MQIRFKVEINGVSPLLMHRYGGDREPDPKPPRGKKNQAWIDKMHATDWQRAAYHDGEKFIVPSDCIEAMMVAGAKRARKGVDFQWGCAVEEDSLPLLIERGGKMVEASGSLESYYVPEFIDLRGVRIQSARVDRCRPKFKTWALQFTALCDDEIVSQSDLTAALTRNALGDFRPRFGRFVAKITRAA